MITPTPEPSVLDVLPGSVPVTRTPVDESSFVSLKGYVHEFARRRRATIIRTRSPDDVDNAWSVRLRLIDERVVDVLLNTSWPLVGAAHAEDSALARTFVDLDGLADALADPFVYLPSQTLNASVPLDHPYVQSLPVYWIRSLRGGHARVGDLVFDRLM